MTVKKNILRFWIVFCVLLAVALSMITLSHRWHSIFPSYEVSELYTRYENVEGIEVSFIKNFRVNDTVAVDVTLLEATDSAGWARMKEDFCFKGLEDFPPEEREMLIPLYSDRRIMQRSPYKNYKMPDTNRNNNDIITYIEPERKLCVFHTANLDNRFSAVSFIIDLMINDETLNIKNPEESI